MLSYHLFTVGARAFPIAGTHIWNGMPAGVTSALSQYCFISAIRTLTSFDFHYSSDNGPSNIYNI